MTPGEIRAAVDAAVKHGNWLIRADDDGVSIHELANGFRWAPLGEWTEAPDWSKSPRCGGGLHGQGPEGSGFIVTSDGGSRLVFCDTDRPRVVLEGNKVKVRRARILLANELPAGLSIPGDLNLQGTQIDDSTLPPKLGSKVIR